MEKGPHVPVMAVEDPARKHNFKCIVRQFTLELRNMCQKSCQNFAPSPSKRADDEIF